LRSGNPIYIDPKIGFILGAVWLIIMYDPFKSHPPEHKIHFFINVKIATIICGWLSITFGLMGSAHFFSFEYFGSIAWLSTLLALPLTMLYDRRNVTSIFDTYYSKRVRQ